MSFAKFVYRSTLTEFSKLLLFEDVTEMTLHLSAIRYHQKIEYAPMISLQSFVKFGTVQVYESCGGGWNPPPPLPPWTERTQIEKLGLRG